MLSPAINVSPWTKEETIKLLKLGKEYEVRKWKEIAEKIGVSLQIKSGYMYSSQCLF